MASGHLEAQPTVLLVVAHGSSESDAPQRTLYRHLEAFRKHADSPFSEIRGVFLKASPHIDGALDALTSAVVLPALMSPGYFTDHVIPARLGLSRAARIHPAVAQEEDATKLVGPAATWVRLQSGGARVAVGRAIGDTSAAHQAACSAIEDEVRRRKLDPADVDVVVFGHGTRHSEVPLQAVRRAARSIAASRGGVVGTAMLEGGPSLEAVVRPGRTTLLLPYFAAPGPHVTEDVAELADGVNRRAGSDILVMDALGLHPEFRRAMWCHALDGYQHLHRAPDSR